MLLSLGFSLKLTNFKCNFIYSINSIVAFNIFILSRLDLREANKKDFSVILKMLVPCLVTPLNPLWYLKLRTKMVGPQQAELVLNNKRHVKMIVHERCLCRTLPMAGLMEKMDKGMIAKRSLFRIQARASLVENAGIGTIAKMQRFLKKAKMVPIILQMAKLWQISPCQPI